MRIVISPEPANGLCDRFIEAVRHYFYGVLDLVDVPVADPAKPHSIVGISPSFRHAELICFVVPA